MKRRGYGSGSIYYNEQKGKWLASIHDAEGKRHTFAVSTATSAKHLLSHLALARNLGKDLAAQYLEWKEVNGDSEAAQSANALKPPRRKRNISLGKRFRILERDNFACVYCGSHAPNTVLHIDHVLPFSEGGDNSDGNLVTACADCNLGKSARTGVQQGWMEPIIAQSEDGRLFVVTRYEGSGEKFRPRVLHDVTDQLQGLLEDEYQRGYAEGKNARTARVQSRVK